MKRAGLRPSMVMIVAVILVIVPLLYFPFRILYPEIAKLFLEPKPFDEFVGSFFTSITGVIVGVLIALEIDREKQVELEARAKEQKIQEETTRKSKILELIKQELTYTKEVLSDRKLDDRHTATQVIVENRLRNESWKALSDGGELEWIQDSLLISKIAIAYGQIRGIDFLEEKYLQNIFNGYFATLGDIQEWHRVQKEKVIREIDTAIEEIDHVAAVKQLPLSYFP